MSTPALTLLVGLIGVAAFVLALIAARGRVERRLAMRGVRRRPAETALVVFGSLLGTAIITGSLIVGDSLTSSVRAGAFTQLGPIDETVTAPGVEPLRRLRQALSGLESHPAVDGVVFGLRARGTVAARVGHDHAAVQPRVVLLELDFDKARNLGGDRQSTGLDEVATPAANHAVVSADLADELDVDAGGHISVFAYESSRRFEVSAVLPAVGLAGYSTGLDTRSFTAFLPPGTLADLAADAPHRLGASPPISLAFVSNQGDVLSGVEESTRVTQLIGDRLDALPEANVVTSKRDLLDAADQIGSRLSEVFLGIGAFAVIAGILLVVTVFVMLAEERRSELGIMRAVGMSRGSLVGAFLLEGTLYAAAAAAMGAILGIGVGAGIVQLAQAISGGPAGFTLDLRFSVQVSSVVGGLLIGLLISLMTIAATSARISRLNIIRAIHDIPDPPQTARRHAKLVAGGLTAAAGLLLTTGASSEGLGLLLGPALLAGGSAAVLSVALPVRPVITALGALVVAWGILAPTLVANAFRNADVAVFVAQGLVITAAAVAVLAANQSAIGWLIRRAVGGSASLVARLGLAYPLARPFRTTMTLAMYSLVVFMLVLVSVLSRVFGGQVEAFTTAEAGSYDLLVRSASTNPLPADAVRQLDGVRVVAPLRYAAFNVEFRAPGEPEYRRWFASGFDRHLLRVQPPALDRWLPRLATERAAWEHVRGDPSTMIVSSLFLQEGGSPQQVEVGDVIEIRDPVTGVMGDRRIVAVMKGGFAFSGAFMSAQSLTSVLGPRAPANRLYVALDEQANSQQIAARLEQRHIRNGAEARTFHAIVADRQQQNLQFFRLMQGYLVLGVLVGIAGLGVIMVRAVRERRRQIGVLRSIGAQASTIRRALMLEAGFVALQGTLIGASLATATAYQLIANAAALGGIDVGFIFPAAEIALLLAIILTMSVLAAAWPARQASRVPPAVAARTAE